MQQNEILELTQLGLWVIQIDTASDAYSMRADSRMLQLLQVDGEKSGREILTTGMSGLTMGIISIFRRLWIG